jgi:hypothetical protein
LSSIASLLRAFAELVVELADRLDPPVDDHPLTGGARPPLDVDDVDKNGAP